MMDCFISESTDPVAIGVLSKASIDDHVSNQPSGLAEWFARNDFSAKTNTFCMVPASVTTDKKPMVYIGISKHFDVWSLSLAPTLLPQGDYYFNDSVKSDLLQPALLGWALGSYQFSRYQDSKTLARLVVESVPEETLAVAESITLVRDLINTPAGDMMPQDLAGSMQKLADECSASFEQLVGDELLDEYPLIHAVGRASIHPPRLLKLSWGKDSDPHIVLVGKGVCFDSGGLDIKPASGMRYMQKDMGGAAQVIGLARLIMKTKLPIHLTVFVAAAENAISSNAFRPGDILRSHAGPSIEIENTDAEGRLVLADPLAIACQRKPEMVIDFATLTGAARVAVGTEIAALFSNDPELSIDVIAMGDALGDPVWQLPLHSGYEYELKSDRADLKNCASSGFGGAITAALFLKEFVDDDVPWLHFDMMAWNNRARPGRPKGGEAMGLRAMYACLKSRYDNS